MLKNILMIFAFVTLVLFAIKLNYLSKQDDQEPYEVLNMDFSRKDVSTLNKLIDERFLLVELKLRSLDR
jgi:hypothetical protein